MRQAKASTNDRPGGPAGKRKVMIYVPADVHRAVRELALDEDRPASDVYVAAARRYLASSQPEPSRPAGQYGPSPFEPDRAVADLTLALQALATRLDGALRRDGNGAKEAGGSGTKATIAMRAILSALRQAGPAGVASRELSSALRAAGVRSGTAEAAKATLRASGIVRGDGGRLYLAVP